jgi:hypothetical protein
MITRDETEQMWATTLPCGAKIISTDKDSLQDFLDNREPQPVDVLASTLECLCMAILLCTLVGSTVALILFWRVIG